MPAPHVLAILLAGGEGSRLGVLTEDRAKPAVPLGGTHRLVDVALSNLAHSGLSDVWVVVQYRPHTLEAHLGGGRPWDLDRTYGGLRVLPPFQTRDEDDPESGFAKGNADALFRHRHAIDETHAQHVLVLSADHLYRFDFRRLVAAHDASGADLTLVTTPVPEDEDGSRFGIVEVDREGRVTAFHYKPEHPPTRTAAAELFLYRRDALVKALNRLDARKGDDTLGDYGHELVPHFVEQGTARAVRHGGYWRDIGTIASYHRAHLDLIAEAPPLDLDAADWPILTRTRQRSGAVVRKEASVDESRLGPGSVVAGTVVASTVGAGAVVEAGAVVRGSALGHGVVVRAGAVVEAAIVDEGAVVGEGARVGRWPSGVRLGAGAALTDAQIAVVGRDARLGAGVVVAPGEALAPRARGSRPTT